MKFPEIKKLGFGLMRLPMKEGKIDQEETERLTDRFMEAGYSYFDTAWAYPGSEEAAGKALVARYPRESFWLTTKNSCWKREVTTEELAQRQFYESLEHTGAGYFDLYLLHNLGSGREKAFDRFHMWDFIAKKKEEGLIRHTGISAHCSPQLLDEVLTAHPEVEFVQLQINYGDWTDPTINSGRCYETARKHGKTVIVMEPVKGGLLASPPEEVREVLKAAEPDRSPASWALRFPASLPGVGVVLSGMSSMEQMEENIATFDSFTGLSDRERDTLGKAAQVFEQMPLIPCTSCNYCSAVCPKDIGISGACQALNIERIYHNAEAAKGRASFNILVQGRKLPAECLGCGACEDACPQKLPIRKLLAEFNEKIRLSV